MDAEKKSLTVAYGSFSCTLEGFEDPVDVLREVAVFVRDLAAEDRAFGDASVMPDPGVLEDLADAEATVSDDGGITLRQSSKEGIGTAPDGTTDADGTIAASDTGADEDEDAEWAPVDLDPVTTDPAADVDAPASPSVDPSATEAPAAAQDDGVATRISGILHAGTTEASGDTDPTDIEFDPVDEEEIAPATSTERNDAPVGDDADPSGKTGTEDLAGGDLRAGIRDMVGTDTATQGGVEIDGPPPTSRPEGPDDLDRIVAATNSHLDEAEGTRRRSAFAHLRVAAAATKADRLLRRFTGTDEGPYRDDLAQAVGQKDADAPRDRTRPAPLVLASERRASRDGTPLTASEVAASEPLNLRRAAHDTAEAPEIAEAAAQYAAAQGAVDLIDRIEATAAHSALILAEPHISRSQLMRRVANRPDGEDRVREDGLRAFGHLLRQGRIEKLARGQFRIGPASPYSPDPGS